MTTGDISRSTTPDGERYVRWSKLRDVLENVMADCINADTPDIEARALDRAADEIMGLWRTAAALRVPASGTPDAPPEEG